MASKEIEAIAEHVREMRLETGIAMRFLKAGRPRSFAHRPAMWVNPTASPTTRTLEYDHPAGIDGYRQEGTAYTARMIRVENAVENGMPTADMMKAIDDAFAWRAFENRRKRLLRRMKASEPDWSKTAHVVNLAAFGVEGVKSLTTRDGMDLHDASGYIHGDTGMGVAFRNRLDATPCLIVNGDLPATVRASLVGRPIGELIAIPALRDCPEVRIVGIEDEEGPPGPKPMMRILVEDVRATLAPVPEGVDGTSLLPPGARFAT